MRHIHLHPLGGAAGDMFVACLLDAFPQHEAAVIEAVRSVAGVLCRLEAYHDGLLTGRRFRVDESAHHDHQHGHHLHVHWRDIRTHLMSSKLEGQALRHAIGIFEHLADAEARVHGVAVEQVTFHEVGATDSIADIVAAAMLIALLGPTQWSVAALPIGGGTVRTAHGLMPVPAPATALLLDGFALHDDGVGGERVTPTGAAILRYLQCAAKVPVRGVLRGTGYGFGTRTLRGISNCLRALLLEAPEAPAAGHRELSVICFEVDDQSGEDLALGLERVRAVPGVHDVVQMPAFGKKSRLSVHVQVLAAPDALEAAVAACFAQTTTIGLRISQAQGRALPRYLREVDVDGQPMTVKLAIRPDTDVTAKAEADHVRSAATHAARARLRREAECLACASEDNADHLHITGTQHDPA